MCFYSGNMWLMKTTTFLYGACASCSLSLCEPNNGDDIEVDDVLLIFQRICSSRPKKYKEKSNSIIPIFTIPIPCNAQFNLNTLTRYIFVQGKARKYSIDTLYRWIYSYMSTSLHSGHIRDLVARRETCLVSLFLSLYVCVHAQRRVNACIEFVMW